MGFFDYFDPCKTTDTNTTDAGVPFSTEPHPFCFDDAGIPSCSDDSPLVRIPSIRILPTPTRSIMDLRTIPPTTRIRSVLIRSVQTTFEKGS